MEEIRAEHNQILSSLEPIFRRGQIDEIDWNEQLLFIKGSRGIGKTTLILQFIKENFEFRENALYVSMDSINTINASIYDIAKDLYNSGGTHLFIDEIHKYPSWSLELKNIRDKFKKLHVIVSGSSILDLYKGNADLSRRGVTYTMQGLSLREYINIETKNTLRSYSLSDILLNHTTICSEILRTVNPLAHFRNYLVYGYYPFYLEGTKHFHQKLNNTINQVLEVDIPSLFNLEISNINKIKKLLHYMAVSVPLQLNSTKLAQNLELNRQTLNTYLQYLQRANILQLLWNSSKSYSLISKPEKIYLHDTNICHLIPNSLSNVGTIRETFFMNQLSVKHNVSFAEKGDFLVDNKYTFEVGGDHKSFKQIANLQNSYLAIDNEMIGSGNKIPLWLFGFMY